LNTKKKSLRFGRRKGEGGAVAMLVALSVKVKKKKKTVLWRRLG